MRPIRLEMRDFMSHKETVIDFSEIDIAAIVGSNGAGKSTILQAITYALWGEVRTASHNDVVRRGSGTCAVMLVFALDNTEYTVLRRRHLSGRGSSDLEFSVTTHSKKFIPLTKATLKETQAEINRLLGMSYDAFSNSALLQQGEASRFSDARPGERKELLAEMLNLRWFQILEERARQKLKQINTEFASTTALCEDKQEKLSGMDNTAAEIDGAIETANEERGFLQGKLNIEDASLNVARKELDGIKEIHSELKGKLELAASYEERKAEIVDQIKALTDREGAVERVLDQAEEIEAAKEELDQAQQEKDEMAEVAIEHGKLQVLADGLEEDRVKLEEVRARQKSLSEQIVELDAECDELEANEIAAIAELNRLIELAHEATAVVHKRTAMKDGVEERIRLLSGPEPDCPTCGSRLQDKDGILKEEGAELQRTSHLLKEAQMIEAEALAVVKSAEERRDELRSTVNNAARKFNELNTQEQLRATEIENYDQSIRRKEKAQHELDALGFDQEIYDGLITAIALDGGEADRQYNKLVAAGEEILRIGEEKQEAFERLNKGVQMIGDLEKEIGALEDQANSLPSVSEREEEIANCEAAIESLRGEMEEVIAKVTQLEGVKEQIESLEREIVDLESKLGQLEIDRRVCNLLVKAASKSGVQALVIEAAIPQLEKDANDLLLVMAHNMKLALQSQRLTQKGTAMETLDIVVYSGGQVAPIETLSGGERFRADLALRLAIGRMVARRSSAAIDMLAIDEGFGSQDSDGQEAVVEVISSLQGLFGLILVISHVQAVAEAIGSVGNMIVVSKSGDESKVEVV